MVQNLFNDVGTDLVDYRTPVVVYLHDPSAMVDKSIRQVSFKYAMVNDELYRRTAKTCYLSAQILIKLKWLWEFTKHLWYALIGSKNEMAATPGQILLAHYDSGLFSLLESMRRVPMIWKCPVGACYGDASYHQTVAFQRMGTRLHCSN